MDWKYTAINKVDSISLHDCTIASARFENGDLILSFADGFKALDTLEQNPAGALASTGDFEIVFPQCEEYSLRILTYRRLHFFKWNLCFGRRWREIDGENPEQFLAFFKKHPTEIVTEYHTVDLSSHHYECSLWDMYRGMNFLSLVRLKGRRMWLPLPGTRAYERFEKKHWEDDYDEVSISLSRSGSASLMISAAPFQREKILYRWNEFLPEEPQ